MGNQVILPSAILGALDEVRAPVRAQIRELLATTDVVGLHGPAHAGKSTLLRQIMGVATPPWGAPVLIDLDGAYSSGQVRWMLLRGLARAVADPIAFSHLTALDRSVWPSRARSDALVIGRELGDLAAVALDGRGAPKRLNASMGEVLQILGRMSRTRNLTVIIEHIEAPSTTARHPVDADELLWQIRSVAQRRERLQVVMTARPPAVALATGTPGAFHGDGRWIALDPPDAGMWLQAAELLGNGIADGVPACVELTAGHVPTMVRLLADPRSRSPEGAARAFDELSAANMPYAARCVEHARSIHRLGGTLLAHVARHDRPYAAIPSAGPKDVGRALHLLSLAGLVHQPTPRRWQVTDPLVAHALRGLLPSFTYDP